MLMPHCSEQYGQWVRVGPVGMAAVLMAAVGRAAELALGVDITGVLLSGVFDRSGEGSVTRQTGRR